ncbi:hypothetical protein ACJMK2_006837 [Sinanodonta woodiana]|uniref:Uncharacterized protein n=1 Tax=Sinanodonta woodiana TaxID=1069815 RepID=A0ABD3VXM4_SINWO
MVEGCLDCATGAWYIINIFEGTRYRADSELSQVLEDAYQKRRKYAVFQDKDTKSTIRVDIENNYLYVEGIPLPHAHIERVVEKRKEALKEKKESMSKVVDGSQSRQTISNNKDAAESVDAISGLTDESLGPGDIKSNSVIKDQEVMLSAKTARYKV